MDARPVCPQCGGFLFEGPHGDLTCISHGHLLRSDVLDRTLGLGTAAHARHMAAAGQPAARRCPLDRTPMATLATVGGNLPVEACARCGTLWVPGEVVERLLRTTPPDASTEAEARSILALAAGRAVLAPADPTQARR